MKRVLVFTLWAMVITAYLAFGWVVGLFVLVVALVALWRLLSARSAELAPSVRCPSGHEIPTYGRVECAACGFVEEGSLWRCGHCGARYGSTRCLECGLSVPNPGLVEGAWRG